MTPREADHVGFCTICQTVHVSEKEFSGKRECENCGSNSVYSINEASDIINDYLVLKEDYKTLTDLMDESGY